MLDGWFESFCATSQQTLLIVRHGETAWTRQHRMTSYTDVPLTATGIEQGRRLAGCLRHVQIDSILTSPMVRADHTARLIADANDNFPTVQTRDYLREIDFGKFEGWPDDAADDEFRAWRRLDSPVEVPGVETAQHAFERAKQVLDTDWKGLRVAVTHGCLGRIIVAASVLGMDPESYRKLRLDPCGAAIISWHTEGLRLSAMNMRAGDPSGTTGDEPCVSSRYGSGSRLVSS